MYPRRCQAAALEPFVVGSASGLGKAVSSPGPASPRRAAPQPRLRIGQGPVLRCRLRACRLPLSLDVGPADSRADVARSLLRCPRLPRGVRWPCRNIGANSGSELVGFYSRGELASLETLSSTQSVAPSGPF